MPKFLASLPYFRNRTRLGSARQLVGRVGPKRGGIALGALLSLAIPFIVRKVKARRAEHEMQPAL